MGWTRQDECEHAKRVFRPESAEPPLGAVIVLHDADGSLPGDAAPNGSDHSWEHLEQALTQHALLAVVPQDPLGWWFSDPTSNGSPLDGTVAWLERETGCLPPRIALLGFGAGGHAALRIAYQHPRQFPTVAALKPAIDCHELIDRRIEPPGGVDQQAIERLAAHYGDPERARQDSAVLHIHPLNWPRNQAFACPLGHAWHGGADRLRMKLFSLGVPHEADLDAHDHPDYDRRQTARLLAWIAERIATEARRA